MQEVRFCELLNMPSAPDNVVEFTTKAKVKALGPPSPVGDYAPFLVDDGIQDGYIYVRAEALAKIAASELVSFIGKEFTFKGFTGVKVVDSELPAIMVYHLEECVYA